MSIYEYMRYKEKKNAFIRKYSNPINHSNPENPMNPENPEKSVSVFSFSVGDTSVDPASELQ